MKLRCVSALLVLMLMACLPARSQAPAPSLLSNGDFETDAKSAGWPDGWPHPQGTSWEQENGNHFLRLKQTQSGKDLIVYRAVPVPADAAALQLSFRVRYADVKRGKENWHDARIIVDFKDAGGKKLAGGPGHPNFTGSSAEWKTITLRFNVPAGAKTIEIMPALFAVESGTLDLDDLRLIAAAPEIKPPIAPKPIVPSLTVTPPAKCPPVLRVVGNELRTPDGKAVWLQGLAIASMEWTAAGEHILESVGVGIDQWKANIIRLPVQEEFWFGRGKYQNDGGAAYRKLADAAVEAAASRGAYLALDLHRFGAPMDEHVEFWKDAAVRYKDHPAVLFDLFNETHSISWEIWRSGGELPAKGKSGDVNVAENQEKVKRPHTPGMQALVDAVRATGAKNIVIAGGLDWGYDLSGVVNGFALEDKGGNGVMYSSHIYPWKKGWQARVLAAAEKYPLLIGEVGCTQERMPFIPPEQHEDPYTWAPDMLGLIQKHKLHWTAWCFHPTASPQVLKDWKYTPTPYWGEFVKDALSGKQFEMKKMR